MTRRQYTQAERDEAVELARTIGLANAVEQLENRVLESGDIGIPKSSIKTWAKNANVDVATPEQTAAVEKATNVSVVNRQQRSAQAKERMLDKVIEVAEKAAEVEMDMLSQPIEMLRLDHVVGARTRAIHDWQLLEGKPTDIIEDIDVAALVRLRDELGNSDG